MNTTPRGIAKSLDPSRYAAFLSPDDQVAVTRNTRGNLNPGFAQTMTVEQARAFRAWDTASGTMSASVTHAGLDVHLCGRRAYVVINSTDEHCLTDAATDPRETLTCWSFD